MLLSYHRSYLNMLPTVCKSKQGFLIWGVSGDNMLRLHCASDIPFCCLYTPFTIPCPLTTSNSCHILLSCFSTSLAHDSRNNCTKQRPFLQIPSLSFTWQKCLLSLHLWKLASPGQERFLCLHAASCFIWLRGSCTWEPFASNIHSEELSLIYGKSPGKPSACGTLMTQLFEALGNGFFIIFSGVWWSDCASISCLELSYWHHSFTRSKAINLFFILFPEEIICMCLLGVFWQMCWSVVLHHWCFAVKFQTSSVADPQNCNAAEMVMTWNCL